MDRRNERWLATKINFWNLQDCIFARRVTNTEKMACFSRVH